MIVQRLHLAPSLPRALLLSWFISVAISAQGQFTIEGIADRQVYTGSVELRVIPATGFTSQASLDETLIPLGVFQRIDAVDFHELNVSATNEISGVVTNALVRFVVRASERGTSEIGLPPWTPYPTIPSTAAETAGASLRLVVPQRYPTGLPIPVIAWVEDTEENAVRVNGAMQASAFPPITIRRGVGSGFLPAASASFNYGARLGAIEVSRSIEIETNTAWAFPATSIDGNLVWPDGSRVRLTNDVTIAAGATLTIGAGTVVLLGPTINIAVLGSLVIEGSEQDPVVFAPAEAANPWGGFFLTNNASKVIATHAIFTGSGANPNGVPNSHRNEQALFFCDNHCELSLTNCAAIQLAGQFGHSTDRGTPGIKSTLFTLSCNAAPQG
jgi:hypothetical protein